MTSRFSIAFFFCDFILIIFFFWVISTMAIKDLVHASTNPAGDVDNFEHILQVTSHQEAVYAYYYMDENNKVSL